MQELIVTGCIVSPCRKEPEWLVPAFMQIHGGSVQLDVMLQVCNDHLFTFGYNPLIPDDLGYPGRLASAGLAQIMPSGRSPHHLRRRIVDTGAPVRNP